MITGVRFWIEKAEDMDLTREILVKDFKLVSPHQTKRKNVLVWEDSERIGRYRVHFFENLKLGNEGLKKLIQFSYWMNEERAKREIFEADPMKYAVDKVRSSLQGRFIEDDNYRGGNITIEEALRLAIE